MDRGHPKLNQDVIRLFK